MPLRRRLARYLSAPLSPVESRDLPARVRFRIAPSEPFEVEGARVRCALVNHRGPTLGYRIADGDNVVCYLPDHEPALGQPLDRGDDEWISGLGLARDADLLIHDGQYTDREYWVTRGRGHSTVPDAVDFAVRARARRLALFHHDPSHDDEALDLLRVEATDAGSPPEPATAGPCRWPPRAPASSCRPSDVRPGVLGAPARGHN